MWSGYPLTKRIIDLIAHTPRTPETTTTIKPCIQREGWRAQQLVVPSTGRSSQQAARGSALSRGDVSPCNLLCCLEELSPPWSGALVLSSGRSLPVLYPSWPSLGGCCESILLGGPTALTVHFLCIFGGPKVVLRLKQSTDPHPDFSPRHHSQACLFPCFSVFSLNLAVTILRALGTIGGEPHP